MLIFLKSQWLTVTYIILSFFLQSYKIAELQPLQISD